MKIIQAIKDKVVVEMTTVDKTTKGGIIIPDTVENNDPHRFGKVISVGPDVTGIEPGDILVFAKHGGLATRFDGKILITLCHGEIFGKLAEVADE